MKLFNVIEKAMDFGTFRSRDNFASFSLKIMFYILPAVIFGNYTDTAVQSIQTQKILGNNILNYIILQTLIIVVTLYIFVIFLKEYMSEFQESSAGSYFIVLYFGMQTNYIKMLKGYMTPVEGLKADISK